jgi:hypothetical protein
MVDIKFIRLAVDKAMKLIVGFDLLNNILLLSVSNTVSNLSPITGNKPR